MCVFMYMNAFTRFVGHKVCNGGCGDINIYLINTVYLSLSWRKNLKFSMLQHSLLIFGLKKMCVLGGTPDLCKYCMPTSL